MGWVRAESGWEFRPTEPETPRAWLKTGPDRQRYVVVENHGEQNAGVDSVVIVPDRPVSGVSRFHTNDGHARFDPNGRWLIIEGGTGFVAVHLSDGSVAHYADPEGATIDSWWISAGSLEWTESRPGIGEVRSRSLHLDEIRARWQPGFGPFANGEFQPHRLFVGWWDKWAASGDRARTLLPLPAMDQEQQGAFTVSGNRAAALLALTVVVVISVIAGLTVGWFARGGLGSDSVNLFAAIIAMVGLAPGLVVAETLVRHPRWIHFGSDSIVVRQVFGEKRWATSKITDMQSVQFAGTGFRFPTHVLVIYFSNAKPLRIDSDMVERSGVRDVATMQDVERRVRQLYEHPGVWQVTERQRPELAELIKSAQ